MRSSSPRRRYVDAATFAVEFHDAVDQSEQGEVFALPDAFAGMKRVADLPDDDVPSDDRFTGIAFHTAALPGGIATIAAGTLTFLMCHELGARG